MNRAYSAIFTAAAALGVVGVLAFALQSVGDETPARAESGARYRPTPDLPDPGATRSEKTHRPKKTAPSEAGSGTGLTVSSSAEPEPLPTEKKTPSGERDVPAGSDSAEPSRTKTATPTDRSPAGASASGSSGAPASPDGRIGDSGRGRAPAEPTDPTGSPDEPQGEGEDEGGTQEDGPLKRTVDGVLGGVGSGVNGLLGN
ncbi:hypothetical protein ABT112_04515 [Streptomyces sp. NPDC002055]|uniref:hypothetical protein n=1 Tax=Streptomyces sp. NPDC002055 TaxID=3154534 RepID=UPI00332B2973